MIERLEDRAMLSASLKLGVAAIKGTAKADVIGITQSNGILTVKEGKVVTHFALSKVNKIVVSAAAGNDKVTVAATVSKPCSLLGGAGNDTLTGGAGIDTIKGGLGNDLLSGGAGADLIFGEGGLDVLKGGAGDDTLTDKGGAGDTIAGGLGHDLSDSDHQFDTESSIEQHPDPGGGGGHHEH
jgi:Ca2+-binding RTX toxin-like protein